MHCSNIGIAVACSRLVVRVVHNEFTEDIFPRLRLNFRQRICCRYRGARRAERSATACCSQDCFAPQNGPHFSKLSPNHLGLVFTN